MADLDNQQPNESISNRVPHVHHYVLKGSGGSHYAECAAVDPEARCPHDRLGFFCDEHCSWLCSAGQGKCQTENDCPVAGPQPLCGEKLAGDNGPIVGSRAKVQAAMP